MLLRSAFKEWASLVEPRSIEKPKEENINIHMHGTQIQVFAQRSRLLVEELKSLMSEWHKDEIRSEANTAKKVKIFERFFKT